MKTNLDQLFKQDTNLETEGIFLQLPNGASFKVRRFGGSNTAVKKAMLKHYKPFAKLIEKGLFPEEKEKEIYSKAFIDACLVDWSGVEVDGKELPFTKENAARLFKSLPELADTLVDYAQDKENFKDGEFFEKEDVGN